MGKHGVPNISKARSITQLECLHLRHSALKHRKLIGLGQHKQHVVARGRHGKARGCSFLTADRQLRLMTDAWFRRRSSVACIGDRLR